MVKAVDNAPSIQHGANRPSIKSLRHYAASASAAPGLAVLRRLVQRCCANMVFRRRLPVAFSRMQLFVAPSATLEYLLPSPHCFDPTLLLAARNYVTPDSIVWDIGANVGAFSIAAAALARNGSVLAIEPDPFLMALIQRTLGLADNSHLNVQTLCAAAGARHEVASFCIARNGRASNYLHVAAGRMTAGGAANMHLVPVLPLDSLLETHAPPNFVKIDVEGAEIEVLSGSTELLNQTRPTILIETGPETAFPVTDLLHGNDYALFSANQTSFDQPIANCESNTIAVPRR